jgi:hypothetical protein
VKIHPISVGGHEYALIIIDFATKVRWVYTFKNKKDIWFYIKTFITTCKTQYGRIPKRLRLGGERELGMNQLNKLSKESGILVEKTTPYNHEQNGLPERANRIVLEKLRAAMLALNIPKELWSIVIQTIVRITNRTTTRALKTSLHIKHLWTKLSLERIISQA